MAFLWTNRPAHKQKSGLRLRADVCDRSTCFKAYLDGRSGLTPCSTLFPSLRSASPSTRTLPPEAFCCRAAIPNNHHKLHKVGECRWVWFGHHGRKNFGALSLIRLGLGGFLDPRASAATAPVKKQLIFREGGLHFLFLKRTILC